MKSNMPFPMILGHRGYRAKFPENTVLAFKKAFEFGADGIECDVQKTADGRYVVIHDALTERVTGRKMDVAATKFEELRSLDFGSGERIPEITEMLAAIPAGKYLDLELKSQTLTPADAVPIMDLLDSRIDRKNLMLSSFNIELLVPFRKRGYTVGYLIGQDTADKGIGHLARSLMRYRPQFINLPIQTPSKLGQKGWRRLRRLLGLMGIAILFWTVNQAAEAEAVAPYTSILVGDDVELLVKLRGAAGGKA